MKLTVFSKEIEIDENNKGIKFKMDNIGPTINEITTLFWYKLRADLNDDNKAAEQLRNISKKEMKECVLQNIRDELDTYDFAQGYSKYVY